MASITTLQWQQAANKLNCDVAALQTVYQIETAGHGYLPDGRVKILFEGHRFWKQVVKAGKDPMAFLQHNSAYNTVLYSKWDRNKYIGGVAEWWRMSKAIEVCTALDVAPEAALDSASYGAFQIMGENAELCGYGSAHEMIAAFNNGGEAEQLNAFVNFVIAKKLDAFLRTHNWTGFAEGYNGTGYRENQYDIKLATLYKILSRH